MGFDQVIVAAFICYGVTKTISNEYGPMNVFSNIRSLFGRKAALSESKMWTFLADVIHCPKCLGFWIALVIALAIYPDSPLNFVLLWFTVYGANLLMVNISNID